MSNEVQELKKPNDTKGRAVRRSRYLTPELIVDVSERMKRGDDCMELVTDGKLSRSQLNRIREAVVSLWRDQMYLDDPEWHQTTEMVRLEHIDKCAAEEFDRTRQSKWLGLRLKASSERRKLTGVDAPEKKIVEIQERPAELMATLLNPEEQTK